MHSEGESLGVDKIKDPSLLDTKKPRAPVTLGFFILQFTRNYSEACTVIFSLLCSHNLTYSYLLHFEHTFIPLLFWSQFLSFFDRFYFN